MSIYGDKEREKDFEYFLRNYHDFYLKYGHKFLAIKEEIVLGVFDSEIEAITEITKEHPLGSFIVQECNGDESGYTNYISSWQIISV
ncbi:MAG: hypothetical protein J6A94_04135 [Lachnospiraceae bacterium]|nr:hypothetical protein [Lachnospiraceae bacterium]